MSIWSEIVVLMHWIANLAKWPEYCPFELLEIGKTTIRDNAETIKQGATECTNIEATNQQQLLDMTWRILCSIFVQFMLLLHTNYLIFSAAIQKYHQIGCLFAYCIICSSRIHSLPCNGE